VAEQSGFEPAVPFLNFVTTTLGNGFHNGRLSSGWFQNRNREFEFIPLHHTASQFSDPAENRSKTAHVCAILERFGTGERFLQRESADSAVFSLGAI